MLKMAKVKVWIVLAGWLLTGAAMAAEKSLNCNEIDGSQGDLNACFAGEFAKADADLNATWKKIQTKYADKPLFLEKLKASQRLWLQFRDAEVAAAFPVGKSDDPQFVYGSVYPMCISQLQAALTVQRVNQLKAWLDGTQEGDVCAGSIKNSVELK